MYLWRIDRLKADLSAGPLPESEQFKYLFAVASIWALGNVPFIPGNWYDVLDGAVILLVTALGTVHVYVSNGGSTGSRLLERYMSLGLVVLVRMLVIALIPAAVVFYTATDTLGLTSDDTNLIDVAFTATMNVLLYYVLGKHVREVARQPNQAL